MVFLLLGVVLLLLKLSGVEPFSTWEWFSVAMPFLMALCWFEVFEPMLGLDAKREQKKQALFAKKVGDAQNRLRRSRSKSFSKEKRP